MITRAQAEALLTLAESLEACERLGIWLMQDSYHIPVLRVPGAFKRMFDFKAGSIRNAVTCLTPTRTQEMNTDPSLKIDWSKAPEGTTHRLPRGRWHRIDNDGVIYVSVCGTWVVPTILDPEQYVEQLVKHPNYKEFDGNRAEVISDMLKQIRRAKDAGKGPAYYLYEEGYRKW